MVFRPPGPTAAFDHFNQRSGDRTETGRAQRGLCCIRLANPIPATKAKVRSAGRKATNSGYSAYWWPARVQASAEPGAVLVTAQVHFSSLGGSLGDGRFGAAVGSGSVLNFIISGKVIANPYKSIWPNIQRTGRFVNNSFWLSM
jgi:hypothetical protein